MNFVPSHVTAVILYGHEACSRLGDLLRHWDTILSRNDWDQYIFVMVDDNPPVPDIPAQARHVVPGNIQVMPPANLKHAGMGSVIQKLRDRIDNNAVCLQLVVSFDSPDIDSPEYILDWIGAMQDDFGPGGQHTICYLLCNSQSRQLKPQDGLARALTERSAAFPYVYLLGDFAQDGSTVQDALLWARGAQRGAD